MRYGSLTGLAVSCVCLCIAIGGAGLLEPRWLRVLLAHLLFGGSLLGLGIFGPLVLREVRVLLRRRRRIKRRGLRGGAQEAIVRVTAA